MQLLTAFGTALALLTPTIASAQDISLPINVTNVEKIDQTTRVGELAYGASNLDFGYSAGAGINFGNGT
jgi:hypothetical protein